MGKCSKLHPDMNGMLLCPVTDDEVRRALFHIHPDKSLGPDEMTLGYHPSLANQKVSSLMKVGESSWDEECNGESSGVYSVESVY
ncbi:hypothetical protein G4B88_023068 [Cannabis sativa]|uniref:Uncharacterized protein n=1 Tax=Cannabis sativa TaxID=3483 RepID=A0A7J6I1Z9_CANSA|nr:hypothetical protein G4B88_023068 [Cannabis sativa]